MKGWGGGRGGGVVQGLIGGREPYECVCSTSETVRQMKSSLQGSTLLNLFVFSFVYYPGLTRL